MEKRNDLLITPSIYTLFLYTLINAEWEKSDYVLSERIPTIIHQRLRDLFNADVFSVPLSSKRKNALKKILLTNQQYISYKKYSSNRYYNNVWGNDEFILSIRYRSQGIKLIEDGPFNSESRKFFKKRRLKIEGKLLFYWINGIFKDYLPYGYDKHVTEIYHTPGIKLNNEIAHKGITIDIKNIWKKISDERKAGILKLFGITSDFTSNLSKYSIVLVTQELPIPDKDKIEIYKKMLKGIDLKKILIKTHYAESTNYKEYFPEATILSTPIPMQLFDVIDYTPKKILTISSSAIQPFIKEGVDIVFLGTECDKRIKDVYGIVRLENILK